MLLSFLLWLSMPAPAQGPRLPGKPALITPTAAPGLRGPAASPPAAIPPLKTVLPVDAHRPAAVGAASGSAASEQPAAEAGRWSALFDNRSRRKDVHAALSVFQTVEQLKRLSARRRSMTDTFRFNVIGDAEPGRFWHSRKLFGSPGVFARLLKKTNAQSADFTIQLGDMVSRGAWRNYLRFFRILISALPVHPYLTVIGNHDRSSVHWRGNDKLYRAFFGKTDYHFDHGGWRFVVLDSSQRRVTAKQLEWLDATLKTPLRKIVFTHIPPNQLSVWTDWPHKGAGGFSKGSAELTGLLAKRGVETVYMGHLHAYGVTHYLGVRYVLTGGGGSPLYPVPIGQRFHHFLSVEAGPDGLRETVHRQ